MLCQMSSRPSFLKKVTTVWSLICLTYSPVGNILPKEEFLSRARTPHSHRIEVVVLLQHIENALRGLNSQVQPLLGSYILPSSTVVT